MRFQHLVLAAPLLLVAACAGDGPVDASRCGGCATHAQCLSTSGKVMCVCDTGYAGDGKTCGRQLTNADCGNRCSVHGACVEGDGGTPTCQCSSGYAGDGQTCDQAVPASECNQCSANASCVQRADGRPMCRCNGGYSGDGRTCSRIQPPATCGGCPANAQCLQQHDGSAACVCNEGFYLDGGACHTPGSCADHNGACHLWASCDDSSGTPACTCQYGSEGDGWTCLPPSHSMMRLKGKLSYSGHESTACTYPSANWTFDLALNGDGAHYDSGGVKPFGVGQVGATVDVATDGTLALSFNAETWYDFCPDGARRMFYYTNVPDQSRTWTDLAGVDGGAQLIWLGQKQDWYWSPDPVVLSATLSGNLVGGFTLQ